jgi:hypothetical protein
MNCLMRFQGIAALMAALLTLPDRLEARLAVPRAGEAAAALGHASSPLARRRRARGRGRVRWHGRQGVPRPGFTRHRTGPRGSGPAHQGERMATPGDAPRQGPSVPPSRLRLHAPRRELTAWLPHPEQPGDFPPTTRPRPPWTGARARGHGQIRASSPVQGPLAAGRAGLLGRHGHDRARGPSASRASSASAPHPCDRHAPGGLPRRSVGLTRQRGRAGAQRPRLRPCLPDSTGVLPVREPPRARGPADARRPCPWGPAGGLQTPRRHRPPARGPLPHQRGGTTRRARPGPLLALSPSVPLGRGHGVAVACVCPRRRRPRPHLPPPGHCVSLVSAGHPSRCI